MIKIKAPISRAADCAAFIDAGAQEFYCGVIGEDDIPLNYRAAPGANLPDFDALKKLTDIASGRGVPVYFCINSYKTAYARALQVEQARKALGCGVAGFIIADISLIPEIRRLGADTRIILGTAAACSNSDALVFYAKLGVDRVVLERHLSIEDIRSISGAAALRGIETEVFVQNITCTNINGLCQLHHFLDTVITGGHRRLPPCWQKHELRFFENSGGAALPPLETADDAAFRKLLYCGVCALYPLFKSGVGSAKIVGRGLSAAKLVKDISLLRRYLDACGAGLVNDDNFVSEGAAFYAEAWGFPCEKNKCFYYETRAVRR